MRTETLDVNINQGTVFRKSTGLYTVNAKNGKTVTCSISTKLRKELVYPTRDRSSLGFLNVQSVDDIKMVDPVAVGDVVSFMDMEDGTGHITQVLPRKSKLTRRAPGQKPIEQVIIANADQVITVFAAAQPKPKWHLLDRYLVSAEATDLPVAIVITKMDLVRGTKAESKLEAMLDTYRAIGYPVYLTSSENGEGLDEVKALLKDKLSAFVGISGVGKTTLLNAIQSGLGLAVGRINEKIDKGRHTTTHLEMFSLEFGGDLIDTPGMKQFGLWNIDPMDVQNLFREFTPYLGMCKFGASCTHDHEPQCAIKEVVEDGTISEARYKSYVRVMKSVGKGDH